MNTFKRSIALIIVLCLLFSAVPVNAFATEAEQQPGKTFTENADAAQASESATDPAVINEAETTTDDEGEGEDISDDALNEVVTEDDILVATNLEAMDLTYDDQYRILHLDCGRKYFTADWIKALINEMAAAGYNQLQLAFGNDGLRFLLNDMSFTVNGTTYSNATVVSKVEAGNYAQNSSGDTRWLTQAEMDAIIAHAQTKNIEIVPLLNLPGHANAILDIVDDQYNASGSDNTLNVVNNSSARAFGLAIFKKYVDYFADNGCKFFNFGADEYANDAGDSPFSFSRLSDTEYASFVSFINELTAYIEGKGMTARAFNDGLYYNGKNVDTDKDIQCCYWSSGWGSYPVASASTIANNGHAMINTHGDYYMVLEASGIKNPSDTALNFNNSQFMGSTISNPVGSMFCIWCDFPYTATEQEVAAAARITLRKMAAAMLGTSNYSEEVISGGFNEDGSIAETREWKTVSTGAGSDIEVSGYELTSATANVLADSNLPSVEGASKVVAWDIMPYVDDTKYTERGAVKLPVPEDWNTALVKGFYVEKGEAVLVPGTYADGFYTFNMPHFSVAGLAEIEFDEVIDLMVGKSHTVLIEGVDLTDKTYTPEPGGIATVTLSANLVPGEKKLQEVTSLAGIISGSKYMIGNGKVYLTTEEGQHGSTTNPLLALRSAEIEENGATWTIEENGTSYSIYAENTGYLTFNSNQAGISDSPVLITLQNGEYKDTFGIQSEWTLKANGNFLNNFGGANTAAGGWYEYDGNASWKIYRIVESQSIGGTSVIFTGDAIGDTFVEIEDVIYKIVVHGTKDITINYQTEDGTLIKSETIQVADNATECTLKNFSYGDKYYTVNDTVLPLNLSQNEQNYTVGVTESVVNWDEVEDLSIEFFITNQRVKINSESRMSLSAEDFYNEEGMSFADIVPASDNAQDNPKVLWRGWLLPEGYHQDEKNDMCTNENGTRIQKIRFWGNGVWQYFDGNTWESIKGTDQVVAYYVQQTDITEEVTTNVVDWGETYESWAALNGDSHWFWTQYVENGSKFVFLDFAVVYEDGTQNPNRFPQNDTWFFHFENCSETNPRVLNPMVFMDTSDYEIWKVTVTDGTSQGYRYANSFTSTYTGTETVVWTEDMGGTPRIESLKYTANQSGKLVRIYVRAVEKEDSLSVVYYDEKFGNTLYTYNISVKENVNFTDGIQNSATMDNGRINVSNAYIQNSLGKTQFFQTDLTKVPEAIGKYNSKLYTYAGSKISDDGKTLYLYYTIDQSVVYPNYVADFGLPITFRLSDVTSAYDTVTDVAVNKRTSYGNLEYIEPIDPKDKNGTFVYTPTRIIQGLDVLSINVTFDGGNSQISNVGITPATTVYYEESFLNYDNKWGTIPARPSTPQHTEPLGNKINLFGYDVFYADDILGSNATEVSTNVNGATASFTFTGTGFELFANCDDGTGYVTLTREGQTKKMYMMDTGLNYGKDGYVALMPGTTINPNGFFYNIPIITERNLPYGTYTVTIKKTHNDSENLKLDGIRVFNTMQDSTIYNNDLEDNPVFYELRDVVLTSLGISGVNSTQVFNSLPANTTAVVTHSSLTYITEETAEFDDSESTEDTIDPAQYLLDHGPKNEIYLHKDQTLTFKVETDRVVQIGLKAPNGATKYTLETFTVTTDSETNVETKNVLSEQKNVDMHSSVDMFYSVIGQAKSEGREEITVSVTNTGNYILAVTLLKICDDPDFSFAPLKQEDIAAVMGEIDTVVPPVEPDETDPTEPSKPEETNPTEPTKPEETDPTEPSKPDETDPTEPSKPEETDPTEPSKPEETDPIEPSKPEETDPTEPSKPEETDSTEPSKPEETDPTEPTKPVENEPQNKPFDPDKVEMPFKDVPKGKWFHAGVAFVYHHKLMNGMKEDEFGPSNAMTRAMVVTVLYRLAGSPKTEYDAKYSDIPANKYYTDAVNWAAEKGIAFGVGNNQFDPNGDVTREQLATMLYRYCQMMKYDLETEEDLLDFPDFDQVSKWSKDGMKWAVGKGIINGVKNGTEIELQPSANALRSQIAVILQRFCEQYR